MNEASVINELYSGNINLLINGFNTILFLFGVYLLLRAFRFLMKNRLELKEFAKRTEASDLSQEDVFKVLDTKKFSKKGILKKSMNMITELSKTSLADREKIMYLEDIRNQIRTAVPRAIPNLAVIIGFLGTVLGLYLVIRGLPDIFKSGNLGQSQESFDLLSDTMVGALGGMGTAFGTTLVGLVISLILSLSNLTYKIFWDKYDQAVQELMAIKIFPVFITPDQDVIIKNLVESISESRKATKAIKTSNTSLLKSVDGLTENMATYNNQNSRALNQVIKAITEFSELQKGNQGVYESIKHIATQAGESYLRVEGLLDSSSQDRESFMSYLQDSRNDIREVNTLQHRIYEETNRKFLDTQKEFYSRFFIDYEDHHEKFLSSQGEANNKQMEDMRASSKELLDSMSETSKAILEGITEENKVKVEQFIEQSSTLNEAIKQILEDVSNRIEKKISASSTDFTENVKELNAMLMEFKAKIVENSESYESSTQKLIATLSGLIQKNIETNKFYVGELN